MPRIVERPLLHLLHVPKEPGHFVMNTTNAAAFVAIQLSMPQATSVTDPVIVGLRGPHDDGRQNAPSRGNPARTGLRRVC